MKLSLLLAAVIALPACTSPSPSGPDPAPAASGRAAPVDSAAPAPAARPARLAVVTPTGELCLLDGATGAVRSRQLARAADLAADEDHPGRLATVEPSDDPPGRLARYRVGADHLELLESLPFDAPDGRLLRAGDALVGLAQTEMTTLFWARHGEGPGQVWGPAAAAAAQAAGDSVRVQTAGPPEAHSAELRTALAGARGVQPVESSQASAHRAAPALFALPGGGFGRVETTPTGWRVVGGPHDGYHREAPDEFAVEARLLDDGRRLAVLTGPAARLRVLSVWGVGEAALGGERLAPPGQVGHRLAFDAGRQRVWALAGGTPYAVSLPGMEVVAAGGCAAIALAVVTPDE